MYGILKKTALVVMCIMGGFLVIAIVYGFLNSADTEEPGKNLPHVTTVTKGDKSLLIAPRLREDMLEETLQSVVGVSGADIADRRGKTTRYMGSGVIVSKDGYIITNHHVVGARPGRIEVTLHNGSVKEGETVWSDRNLDLAIVKIKGDGYSFCLMGDAKKLRVGESVVAIGNPLSMQFQRTVTAGIISAVGRNISIENDDGTISYMEDLVQTDASINPGNSGGPLLNENGEVVAINTIKVTSAEGMGFAVPINVCVPVMKKLREVGNFSTPYLGLYAYTPAAARYLERNSNIKKGLLAAKIDPEGPAFEAGIRYGDIITAINSVPTESMLNLREELYRYQSGDTVIIDYIRNGTRYSAHVVLSSAK